MNTEKGDCKFACVSGKGLKCTSKYHYKKVCFFQRWCVDKQRPLNTVDFEKCPILQEESNNGRSSKADY